MAIIIYVYIILIATISRMIGGCRARRAARCATCRRACGAIVISVIITITSISISISISMIIIIEY